MRRITDIFDPISRWDPFVYLLYGKGFKRKFDVIHKRAVTLDDVFPISRNCGKKETDFKYNIKIRYYKFKIFHAQSIYSARDLVHLYVEPRRCITHTLYVCVPQSFVSFVVIRATSLVHHIRFLLTSLYRDLFAVPATNYSVTPTPWECCLEILNDDATITKANKLRYQNRRV